MRLCMLDAVTILLLLLVTRSGSGYPDGAPKNRKVCKTLRPRHEGTHAQTSSAPYSVTPEKTKIPVGGSLKVTISANKGASYKGFVMQARPRMIYNVDYIRPIGTFSILDAKNSKTLDCLSAVKNTVTHTNPDLKTSTSFKWTPPPKYKGPVYFRATFVKDFSTYWFNVSSKIVVGDTLTVDPVWIDTGSSESADEVQLGSSTPDVYEECGLSKACFGVPGDCVTQRSCDSLMAVTTRDSKFQFEMMGKGAEFVAVSLSENGDLDTSSMTKCVLTDIDAVNLHQSGYYEYQAIESTRYANDRNNLIDSSYVDGSLYCKFERDEIVHFNSVEYDLKNKQYFVLLAAGQLGTVDGESFNLNNIQFHASSQKKFLSDVSGFSDSYDENRDHKDVSNLTRGILKLFVDIFDYFMLI